MFCSFFTSARIYGSGKFNDIALRYYRCARLTKSYFKGSEIPSGISKNQQCVLKSCNYPDREVNYLAITTENVCQSAANAISGQQSG